MRKTALTIVSSSSNILMFSRIIEGPNGIELEFEFEYNEGYLDGILGTPYNVTQHGNHGILFD